MVPLANALINIKILFYDLFIGEMRQKIAYLLFCATRYCFDLPCLKNSQNRKCDSLHIVFTYPCTPETATAYKFVKIK